MLAGLRKGAKSKWAIPVIAALAISFAVWGVNDAFTSGSADAVATVGPEKVTITNFARAFQNEVVARSEGRTSQMTTPEARAAGIDAAVLSNMITIAALDAKAGQLGLRASDNALARTVFETPAFHDTVRNEFSRSVYESALANAGIAQREYEDSLRDDLARQQMLEALYTPVTAPQSMIGTRQAWRSESRTVEVLVLPAALAALEAEPDDAALQQVIEQNASAFTRPEMRALTVVWLDMETMQSIVEVSDEDVRALYDFRGDSLSTPETRSFIQITAPDEAAANAAAERLRAGEAAETVAADLELGPPISQTDAQRAAIVDTALADAIFESAEPRVIVAEGALGWAAIQVTGGQEAAETAFEDVEASLRAELAVEGASDTLYNTVSELEDGLGAGLGLEDAAAAAGVAAQSYEPVTAQGFGASGDIYTDLAANPAVLSTAFSLTEGARSDVIQLADGGYAMVQVDSITPPLLAQLSEVRAQAAEFWRAREIDARLQAIEAEARAAIEAGATFAAEAAEIGQPARTELAVVRRGQTSGPIDASLSAQVFGAAQGELVGGLTANGSRVLARVTRIDRDQNVDLNVAGELGAEISNDLLLQFQAALQDDYPVRVYEDQVDFALGEAPVQ